MVPVETHAAEFDEFARRKRALDDALAPFKSEITWCEKQRETILSWYPDSILPPGKTSVGQGKEFDVLISMRDNARRVTVSGKRKLRTLWGAANFLQKILVQLKDLPDPKDPTGLYTEEQRTGPRHLSPVPRAIAVVTS